MRFSVIFVTIAIIFSIAAFQEVSAKKNARLNKRGIAFKIQKRTPQTSASSPNCTDPAMAQNPSCQQPAAAPQQQASLIPPTFPALPALPAPPLPPVALPALPALPLPALPPLPLVLPGLPPLPALPSLPLALFGGTGAPAGGEEA